MIPTTVAELVESDDDDFNRKRVLLPKKSYRSNTTKLHTTQTKYNNQYSNSVNSTGSVDEKRTPPFTNVDDRPSERQSDDDLDDAHGPLQLQRNWPHDEHFQRAKLSVKSYDISGCTGANTTQRNSTTSKLHQPITTSNKQNSKYVNSSLDKKTPPLPNLSNSQSDLQSDYDMDDAQKPVELQQNSGRSTCCNKQISHRRRPQAQRKTSDLTKIKNPTFVKTDYKSNQQILQSIHCSNNENCHQRVKLEPLKNTYSSALDSTDDINSPKCKRQFSVLCAMKLLHDRRNI